MLRTTRNLRAIDREQFREDAASLATVQPDITADQFNTEMHRLLDTHAPSTQRQVTCRRRRSPCYSSIASELRSMKQERRCAERRWLSTGLTIHKEIMNSVKHKISHLVSNAKFTFYSVKVSTSSSVKEVYKVTNNILGKITSTPLPSVYPTDQLPQVFSDFFVNKFLQIRDSIDSQVVHPPSHSLRERHFSGTPLCGFERVTNETVLKFMKQMSPKTCVLDPIPTSLLFECSNEIVHLLTAIVNQSLLTGIFLPVSYSSYSQTPFEKDLSRPNFYIFFLIN